MQDSFCTCTDADPASEHATSCPKGHPYPRLPEQLEDLRNSPEFFVTFDGRRHRSGSIRRFFFCTKHNKLHATSGNLAKRWCIQCSKCSPLSNVRLHSSCNTAAISNVDIQANDLETILPLEQDDMQVINNTQAELLLESVALFQQALDRNDYEESVRLGAEVQSHVEASMSFKFGFRALELHGPPVAAKQRDSILLMQSVVQKLMRKQAFGVCDVLVFVCDPMKTMPFAMCEAATAAKYSNVFVQLGGSLTTLRELLVRLKPVVLHIVMHATASRQGNCRSNASERAACACACAYSSLVLRAGP